MNVFLLKEQLNKNIIINGPLFLVVKTNIIY